jgi:hypothetical protein
VQLPKGFKAPAMESAIEFRGWIKTSDWRNEITGRTGITYYVSDVVLIRAPEQGVMINPASYELKEVSPLVRALSGVPASPADYPR